MVQLFIKLRMTEKKIALSTWGINFLMRLKFDEDKGTWTHTNNFEDYCSTIKLYPHTNCLFFNLSFYLSL